MTPSGKSLFYFGIYGCFTGLLFLIIPETLISITNLPPISPGWTRAVGLLAMIIGTYDIVCGKANIKLFIKTSIYVRFGFAIGATLLVVSGQMSMAAIPLGAVDGLGAIWTVLALRSEASK